MSWGMVRMHELWIFETPFTTHSSGQSTNHSGMIQDKLAPAESVSHMGHNNELCPDSI